MHASTPAIALPAFETLPVTRSLQRDFRSNHAGETGAVFIYLGILDNTNHPEVIAFAREHLLTETRHLSLLNEWLPASCRSALLPLWRRSGWWLGALSARLGPEFTFATIVAVEEFVVDHYQAQIAQTTGVLNELLVTLQNDEAAHRDDAAARLASPRWWQRIWSAAVRGGSAGAVSLARWL